MHVIYVNYSLRKLKSKKIELQIQALLHKAF